MDILIVMVVGMVAGRLLAPEAFRAVNGRLQTVCTCLLICAMGASIGSSPGFVEGVAAWGAQSLVFCVLPMACSVGLVYALTELVLGGARARSGTAGAGGSEPGGTPARARRTAARTPAAAASSASVAAAPSAPAARWHLDGMAVAAVAMLAVGIALGVLVPKSALVKVLTWASEPVLWVLMALVGVSVGMHRGLLASIREHHVKTLVIPLGVVAGSLAGGCMAALACGFTLREGMAAASGLGWYSLAGVTIQSMAGAQLGGIAFLSNLLRELFSFVSIPVIARNLNGYACIAAAAATSEDTTLPMMMRYTDERCVVYSLVNGVICSALVPVLIAACLG